MERTPSELGVCPPLAVMPDTDAAESLDTAYRRYARYVAAVALKLLGRDDEVDDVVQEVFLAALRGLGSLREPEAIKGWLATVTVRIAGRRLRRRRLRAWIGLDRPARYDALVAPGAPADERALLERVYRLLDELPVKERLAWTLRHVEGERLDAVARICGCSLATAKRRVAAAQLAIEKGVGS
jgi:RNA polymerase sigma-70 factor (ECF subfamily)